MGQCTSEVQACEVCSVLVPDNPANDIIPVVFAKGLVPWDIDVGVAKMLFTNAEFTEREEANMNMSDFSIMGLTLSGHFIADIGQNAPESCTSRIGAGDFCGSRTAPRSKWTIRIVLNLVNSTRAKLKVDVVDVDIHRCPVNLNRIIPEDRLNAALSKNLTEHINNKIEEFTAQNNANRVQQLTIDEDSSYAPPPKPYEHRCEIEGRA